MVIFLPISLNICFGCSKEPSHQDGSFEYPQHVLWLRNKKNNFQILSLIWRPVKSFLKHLVVLDVQILARAFIDVTTLCVLTAKAMKRLYICAVSSQPSEPYRLAYAMSSNKISWAGFFYQFALKKYFGIFLHKSIRDWSNVTLP